MEDDLHVTSLRHALEEAIGAPRAPRSVVVSSVHVAHAGALYMFCHYQRIDNLWSVKNMGRLSSLAAVDYILSSMASIIDDPDPVSLPRFALIRRLALSVRASASDVGEGFVEAAAPTLDSVVELAESAGHNPALLIDDAFLQRTRCISRRLHSFMSRTVPIAHDALDADDADDADDSDFDLDSDFDSDDSDDGEYMLVRLNVLSLQDVLYDAAHASDAERRVTIFSIRVSDAAALFALLHTTPNWTVRNLQPVTNLAVLDAMLQVIERGLLRIVRHRPNSQAAALRLIGAYVQSIARRVGTVGGQFAVQATIICNALITYAAAAPYLNADQMRVSTCLIRTRISHFRRSDLTIDATRDSSPSSSSS